MSKEILKIKDLNLSFPVFGGIVRHKISEINALKGINLNVFEKEILGLVGESGSGKTTLAKTILNLIKFVYPETEITGQIEYYIENNYIDLLTIPKNEFINYRRSIQIVFQDPYSSLNPRMTIFDLLKEPCDIHFKNNTKEEKLNNIYKIVDLVGISKKQLQKYPFEFSGGQRQRISIARALILSPKLLILDEPVSALDVSIRSQIINLLIDIKEELGLTYIFISHDLTLVKYFSDRIAVINNGKILEVDKADVIYSNPKNEYTKELIESNITL